MAQPAPPLWAQDIEFVRHGNAPFPTGPAAGQGGDAVVLCTVAAKGKLADCRIDSEQPAGSGFGKMTLTQASGSRVAATARDGSPSEGRTVRIWRHYLVGKLGSNTVFICPQPDASDPQCERPSVICRWSR